MMINFASFRNHPESSSMITFAASSSAMFASPRFTRAAVLRNTILQPHMTLSRSETDLMAELNNGEHQEELARVANRWSPAVESEFERITKVKVAAVDEDGLLLDEVLCSTVDSHCIAITVPVQWPHGKCKQADEMRAAFEELSAAAEESLETRLAPVYETQQQQLQELMQLCNTDFERVLPFFALRYARGALGPTEETEATRMTQLNLEGFTLERASAGFEITEDGLLEQRSSQVSILFDGPCVSPAAVEDVLVGMLTADNAPEYRP